LSAPSQACQLRVRLVESIIESEFKRKVKAMRWAFSCLRVLTRESRKRAALLKFTSITRAHQFEEITKTGGKQQIENAR
jgi:hypothetical protein